MRRTPPLGARGGLGRAGRRGDRRAGPRDAQPDRPQDAGTFNDDMGTGVPGEPADADVPGEGDAAEPCPDDGLACTEVLRDEEGDCITVLQPGFCLIGGACWFAFQPEPELPCFFCVPDLDAGAFVAYQGLACDDGDPCTSGDVCGPEGECSPGVPTDCNDLNADTVQWRATPGDGTTGDLYQYYGERWPGATCEPAAPGCQWAVYSIMVSGTCGPLYGFLEAALAGNLLVGGGPLGTAPLYLVFGSLRILVMVQAARVEVTLSLAGGGSVGQGGLAGGVNKQSLLAAVEAAPADQFPPPLLARHRPPVRDPVSSAGLGPGPRWLAKVRVPRRAVHAGVRGNRRASWTAR